MKQTYRERRCTLYVTFDGSFCGSFRGRVGSFRGTFPPSAEPSRRRDYSAESGKSTDWLYTQGFCLIGITKSLLTGSPPTWGVVGTSPHFFGRYWNSSVVLGMLPLVRVCCINGLLLYGYTHIDLVLWMA